MEKIMASGEEESRGEEEQGAEKDAIHGDLLEFILSLVPLIHLLSPCRVSKNWRSAVFSSLTNFNRIKPWLFIHTLSNFSLESTSAQAYDPRSDTWIKIHKPPIKYATTLRSSRSNFLYVITSSRLFVSDDLFNVKWRQFRGPTVYRDDPIVAVCGSLIVVAGSCWEEPDPLAVEVYDTNSSTWTTQQALPGTLKDRDSPRWLSAAADSSKVFVTVKKTGITYSFDPYTGEWSGPYDLRPDPRAFFSTIGFAGEDLILVCLIGESSDRVDSIRINKVNRETMSCECLCEAPRLIVQRLMANKPLLHQIEISPADGFVYLYNGFDLEEIVFCDLKDCVWGSTRNLAWTTDVIVAGKMVFTCGTVDIQDIDSAIKSGDVKFTTALKNRV